jgi:hypothetical protein
MACFSGMASRCGFASRRSGRLEGRCRPGRSEQVMLAKGLSTGNAPILASITVQVRVALGRLEAKGLVVKIVCQPDTWWELI